MAAKNREPVKPVEYESETGSSEYETDISESDSETPNNNNSKPSSASAIKPAQPEPSKPIAEPKKSESKKPNIKPESSKNGDSSKKVTLQKLSDVDEIDILKEMIEYEASNNVSPNADMDAFLDYIKKNLNVEVTKTQLQDKIRRLKKKYENNKGKDRNVMKPKEKAAFELSEKVWEGEEGKTVVALSATGNESVDEKKTPSRKRKVTENLSAVTEKKALVDKIMNSSGVTEKKALVDKVMKKVGLFGLCDEEKLLRIGAELFEGEERIEGSEKWKKLQKEEMELCIKQLDVKRAKIRLVLDRME